MDYPGFDGFLGTRASFMLDFVFLAMFAVIPIMGWSIYQVKFRRRYQLHKWVQVALGIVLAAEYKHADHCKAEKNLHHLD